MKGFGFFLSFLLFPLRLPLIFRRAITEFMEVYARVLYSGESESGGMERMKKKETALMATKEEEKEAIIRTNGAIT